MYLLESLKDLTMVFIELEDLIYISKLIFFFFLILHTLHLSCRMEGILKLFLSFKQPSHAMKEGIIFLTPNQLIQFLNQRIYSRKQLQNLKARFATWFVWAKSATNI